MNREYLLDDDPVEAPERIENVEELITGADAYALPTRRRAGCSRPRA